MKIIVDQAFETPSAYAWLVTHGLVGFHPKSQLEPWYFLPPDQTFDTRTRWSTAPDEMLIVFARRQDNDMLSCFKIESDKVIGIVVINGWTDGGYDLLSTYATLWGWFKSAIDDIAELVDSEDADES